MFVGKKNKILALILIVSMLLFITKCIIAKNDLNYPVSSSRFKIAKENKKNIEAGNKPTQKSKFKVSEKSPGINSKHIFDKLKYNKITNETTGREVVMLLEEKAKNTITGPVKYYYPYIQLDGAHFFNIVPPKTSASMDLFVPLWQKTGGLVFTDLRVSACPGTSFEGNLHLGYRYLIPEKQRLYGVYGAFDRKRTEFGNYFNQITLGGEFWHKSWFVGGNVYKTIGETSKAIENGPINIEVRRGEIYNNIWVIGTQEKSLSGVDAEVGYEFIQGMTGYIGGYYFGDKDINTVCGPRARITYDWFLDNGKKVLGLFDKIGLVAEVQRDKPRGFTWYLGINVRLGMSARQPVLEGVSRHMLDPVRRDRDIVSVNQKTAEPVRDENSEILNVVTVMSDDELLKAAKDPEVHIMNVAREVDFDNKTAELVTAITRKKRLAFGKTEITAQGIIREVLLQQDTTETPRISGLKSRETLAILSGGVVYPEKPGRPQKEIILLPEIERKKISIDAVATAQLEVEKIYKQDLLQLRVKEAEQMAVNSKEKEEKVKKAAKEAGEYEKIIARLSHRTDQIVITHFSEAQEITNDLLSNSSNTKLKREVAAEIMLQTNPSAIRRRDIGNNVSVEQVVRVQQNESIPTRIDELTELLGLSSTLAPEEDPP